MLAEGKSLAAHLKAEKQKSADLELELDQYRMHHAAEKTLRVEMMAELDKVYSKDKNPFRKQAYDNADDMRIPSGDRKGQVVTMSDHIYLTKCSDIFKQHFAKTYTHIQSWKQFLHKQISY